MPDVSVKQHVVERVHFQQLLDALVRRGYQVIGPTVHDNTVVYDRVAEVSDLPVGYIDEQDGGAYRLRQQDDPTLFAYRLGPHAWKRFLFPPAMRLWRAARQNGGFSLVPTSEDGETNVQPMALLGVRPCELAAIQVQDRVFMGGEFIDPAYKRLRDSLFIIAVNCVQPGKTCFCASMQTGPKASGGFDLALTEVIGARHHYFVVEVGSESGAAVLAEVEHRDATEAEMQAVDKLLAQAVKKMGRTLDTEGLKDLLYGNVENARWDDVGARCMTCGNCTLVCPTCFCVNVEDVTDLSGEIAERWRKWDSCFTMDFSYVFGGSIRASSKSRYRQWMTHKLASWVDQFGTFGCVGCGRCITWCPVGIDITEEARAIRDNSDIPLANGRRSRRVRHGNA